MKLACNLSKEEFLKVLVVTFGLKLTDIILFSLEVTDGEYFATLSNV